VTRPQTLVSTRGQIGAFAQDGNQIAWLSSSPRCSRLVELRNLTTGKQSALASKRGATCRYRARTGVSPMLALAGSQALWGLYRTTLSHQLLTLVTGAARGRDRVVAELETDCDACRAAPALLHAGDGPTLAYSWSGINRVSGARAVKVRGAYPTAFLAVAGTSVAFARYLGSDYAAGPRWSPNGKQLAFTSGRDYGSPSLYLTSPTGKRITNLTGSSYVVTPAWAPTGAALAYVAAGRAKWALWRIDPATRTRKELANDVVAGVRPAWSPNGYTVAFSHQDPTGYRVYTVTGGGAAERLIGAGFDPEWAPDGSKLVFTGPGGVTVANADGTGRTMLAAAGGSPSFSPDGTRIAFERNGGIWVMNADGRGQTQLTAGHDDLLPEWSPGGTLIAFERGEPRQPYVVNPDGSGLWKVSSWRAEGELDWSPDATKIASAEKGVLDLSKADGSGGRRLGIGARTRIEIRNARTGRLEQTIVASGRAQAIALSRSIVAVLADGRLSVYACASGKRLVTRRLPRGVAPELSAAGRNVVFRTGRTIWLSGPHGLRRLALADATPVGLSIEGRRVAWAENVRGRGRIRAAFLR
jgi:WD40 repeat protein